jgi:hypothetical protein
MIKQSANPGKRSLEGAPFSASCASTASNRFPGQLKTGMEDPDPVLPSLEIKSEMFYRTAPSEGYRSRALQEDFQVVSEGPYEIAKVYSSRRSLRIHSAVSEHNKPERINIQSSDDDLAVVLLRSFIENRPWSRTRELFVFPFHGFNSVTVFPDDASRLSSFEFLNDSIIEFYLRYLIDGLPMERKCGIHLFNSYFYNRLTETSQSGKVHVGYSKVKTWAKSVDLFSKDMIFVPINENLHWFLAIIVNPGNLIDVHGSTLMEVETPGRRTDNESSTLIDAKSLEIEQFASQTSSGDAQHIENYQLESLDETLENSGFPTQDPGKTASCFENEQEHPLRVSSPVEPRCVSSITCTPTVILGDSDDEHLRSPLPRNFPIGIDSSAGKPIAERLSVTEIYCRRNKRPRTVNEDPNSLQLCGNGVGGATSIILLDSLRSGKRKPQRALESYLKQEAQHRGLRLRSNAKVNHINAIVPQQPNTCDCGVYLLHFVERILTEPEGLLQVISQRNERDAKNMMRALFGEGDPWQSSEMTNKRLSILQIVLRTAEEYVSWRENTGLEESSMQNDELEADEEMEIRELRTSIPIVSWNKEPSVIYRSASQTERDSRDIDDKEVRRRKMVTAAENRIVKQYPSS